MIKLNNYLRQYRHNDNSDFVLGYEQEGTEAFVSCLEKEIAEQKSLAAYAEQRANIAEKASDNSALRVASLNSQAVNQVKMFNEKVDEIAELKAMIDEFIEEFSCFVAQHECNCGHPSCRTCKECRDAFKVLDNAVKLREGKS